VISFRIIAARLLVVLALAIPVCVGCFGAPAAGQELQAAEYRVKAAFVYKFGDFIDWPAGTFGGPNSPFVIGVVGADPVADELARITVGRTIGDRPVAVRKLRHGDPLAGLQVIFVGRGSREQMAEILAASKGLPVLTVSEFDNGIKAGSMINFVVVSDKVRFDVALAPAEAARLKISSRLLAVARNVVARQP